MQRLARALCALAVLVVPAALVAPPAASADAGRTCDASVVSITGLGAPLTVAQANTPGAACADAIKSLGLGTSVPLASLTLGLASGTASAKTTVSPTAASAAVQGLNLNVAGLAITADEIKASVTGTCVNTYATDGSVANLKINGTPITADGDVPLLLGQVATVALNHVTKTDTGASRDAVQITVLGVVSVTIAHASAGGGPTCVPDSSGNPAGPGAPGGPKGGGTTNGGTGSGAGTGTGTGSGAGTTPAGGTTKPNNGTNASACARLKMWFVPRVKDTSRYLTHPGSTSLTTGVQHGVRYVTRGRLLNCKGQPIARARIFVYHVIRGHKLRKTGIRSRHYGLLTLVLPSNLHTRKILFEYRPNTKSSKVASRATLTKTLKSKSGRVVY